MHYFGIIGLYREGGRQKKACLPENYPKKQAKTG
jgi:hypothetical protein